MRTIDSNFKLPTCAFSHVDMSYRSRPEPGRRGIPSGSANMTPLGGGYGQHSLFPERAAPPQPKKARVDNKSGTPSTTEADSMVEYAGKAAETMFPDVSSHRHPHVSHAHEKLPLTSTLVVILGEDNSKQCPPN